MMPKAIIIFKHLLLGKRPRIMHLAESAYDRYKLAIITFAE